ncbi:MAG: UvrD-helicase domain-containing protein [Acidimicrobiales bacterium]
MTLPRDQGVRDRIAVDLDTTLFVEAGAGTGKTSALVSRVRSLVLDGGERLAGIAVITFTEKAAAELRDRLREAFASVSGGDGEADGPLMVDRARIALHDLDAAPVATLHAFAQRLLSEHPIEAGLPPGLEVLDEISSELEFAHRWDRFVERTLADPDLRRLVVLADVLRADLGRVRDIAVAFDANWDLVERLVPARPPEIPAVSAAHVLEALDDALALRGACTEPTDKLLAKLDALAAVRTELAAVADDEIAAVEVLGRVAKFSLGRLGRAGDWQGRKGDVVEAVGAACATAETALDRVAQACISALGTLVRDFTLTEAERRRREGRLEFHDLLVLARRLLEDPATGPAVRAAARERYGRILIDEFQDTDPLQIDIAAALATDPTTAADSGSQGWSQRRPGAGSLFFVGDPKQSIYRFRRADIGLFLAASDAFGPPVRLVTNWRSSAPVIDWVNAVFAELIEPEEGSQPAYVPLAAGREDVPAGPGAAVLGGVEHEPGLSADEVRSREAADVAATVTTAVEGGWEVVDRHSGETRRCRLGDICILLPARTSLPQLERALVDARIPYRAESSSLVYSTREVRDLIGVLRAIDDPTDELAVVAALRSAAFGCGDDDLWGYHRAGGAWDLRRPVPDTLTPDHPVVEAMAWLARVRRERAWRSPSEIVDRVLRDRGLYELGAVRGRVRDQWRRLRFVADQARAFTDATGGNLRDFIDWIDLQSAGSGRVTEAVLPETDDDAVQILTVHASKGLEFPVTIVSGLTTKVRRRRGGVQVLWTDSAGRPAVNYRFHPTLSTAEFDESLELDEQLDFHEKIRLLYVACTRARDHLVVSLHRTAPGSVSSVPARGDMTAAQLLADAGAASAPPVPGLAGGSLSSVKPREVVVPADRETWERDIAAARRSLSTRRSIAATAVAAELHDPEAVDAATVEATAAGLAKSARDLDLPPWNKGRYGTAIGRAVHATLQTVDLATGEGLGAIASAQAAAEGVVARAGLVAALAGSALDSEVVARAAHLPHWRELYVAALLGERILEGYVDLLYRTPEGLVVVDHKTDQLGGPRDFARAADRYGLQGAAYSLAVEEATGEQVVSCVLLFLAEHGAVAHAVDDLRGRIDRIRAAVPDLVGGGEVVVE